MTTEERAQAALQAVSSHRWYLRSTQIASAHQGYAVASGQLDRLQRHVWEFSCAWQKARPGCIPIAITLAQSAVRILVDICGATDDAAMDLIATEYRTACAAYPAFADAHEGLAVIMEEMDELKAEIWKSPAKRDLKALGREAYQVAAMCVRFVVDVCPEVTE